MTTLFAFTTGLLVGAIGIATAFMSSQDVRNAWNACADEMQS